mmetsp:Transcript_97916/g.253273  ORF Transcript_97916/g.253273 Transcript_97916/m.253273 type:complete len:267 (-) Transcript_97916:35-835(-)
MRVHLLHRSLRALLHVAADSDRHLLDRLGMGRHLLDQHLGRLPRPLQDGSLFLLVLLGDRRLGGGCILLGLSVVRALRGLRGLFRRLPRGRRLLGGLRGVCHRRLGDQDDGRLRDGDLLICEVALRQRGHRDLRLAHGALHPVADRGTDPLEVVSQLPAHARRRDGCAAAAARHYRRRRRHVLKRGGAAGALQRHAVPLFVDPLVRQRHAILELLIHHLNLLIHLLHLLPEPLQQRRHRVRRRNAGTDWARRVCGRMPVERNSRAP